MSAGAPSDSAAARVDVRRHAERDLAEMLAVIRTAFAEHRGQLVPPSSAEHKTLDILRAELSGADAFVAESAGCIVGCVLFRPRDASTYLDRLSVLPQWQGRGIASALIAAVEHEAVSRGFASLTLTVRLALTRQQAMYRHLGFEFASYGTHEGFNEPTSMTMRKSL